MSTNQNHHGFTMNMKMPDFNMKKLVKDAGSTFSRVVQLTEEKLGTSEKTELDAHYESLAERAENTKVWTEKILRNTEAVLTPNPGNRAEDYIFEIIEKKKPTRLSNLEYMGLDMIEAGAAFGQDGPYGSALTKVGQAEQKLGQCEREFIGSSYISFVQPLRKFLDGDMKSITREKGILESKRLDLDACKNRVKKARSMLGQQAAERELRVAQSDFDRQAEITKILLEGVGSSQAAHLRHLHSLVEAQATYFNGCLRAINDLQRELVSLGGTEPYVPVGLDDMTEAAAAGDATGGHTNNGRNLHNQRRARVLCSYDAKDATELNLTGNEVIFVAECNPPNLDYMYGKQGLHKGLVPRAFLEILDDDDEE